MFRYLWAAPASFLGILLAVGSKSNGLVAGVWEFSDSPFLYKIRFPAMTFGHVVLGRSDRELDLWREHERVHVCQYERMGIFFIPLYFVSTFIALMCGLRGYYDNQFEIAAYRKVAHPSKIEE
jgi:hypothetical protein